MLTVDVGWHVYSLPSDKRKYGLAHANKRPPI